MLPKKCVALFIVFFFILSLSAPVYSFSGNMRYDKYYDLDGKILLKIQTGEKGSSPAQHKTLVEGSGAFERDESIFLDPGELSVKADSDWEVDDRQLRGLSVGSAIKLNPELAEIPEEVAEQVFAVKVDSDPGEEGHLNQDWSASESVYDNELTSQLVIDQDAYTSGGQMKRYIDLVDPASEVYLFEDSEIDGYARVVDSLQPAGSGDSGSEETVDEQSEDVEGQQEAENEQKETEEAEEKSDGDSDGFFTTHIETEPQEEEAEKTGDDVFIIESDQFATTVPLGTPLEEIELDQTISLTAEVIEITGIEVKWDNQTVPAYDPDREGSYIFAGKLHFPGEIIAPENMILLYTVHVVENMEEMQVEEEKIEEEKVEEEKDAEEEKEKMEEEEEKEEKGEEAEAEEAEQEEDENKEAQKVKVNE